jgi:hypothetical protein
VRAELKQQHPKQERFPGDPGPVVDVVGIRRPDHQ